MEIFTNFEGALAFRKNSTSHLKLNRIRSSFVTANLARHQNIADLAYRQFLLPVITSLSHRSYHDNVQQILYDQVRRNSALGRHQLRYFEVFRLNRP
jgi:hypothetical protein